MMEQIICKTTAHKEDDDKDDALTTQNAEGTNVTGVIDKEPGIEKSRNEEITKPENQPEYSTRKDSTGKTIGSDEGESCKESNPDPEQEDQSDCYVTGDEGCGNYMRTREDVGKQASAMGDNGDAATEKADAVRRPSPTPSECCTPEEKDILSTEDVVRSLMEKLKNLSGESSIDDDLSSGYEGESDSSESSAFGSDSESEDLDLDSEDSDLDSEDEQTSKRVSGSKSLCST